MTTEHYLDDDDWARVELFRWQYGELPQDGDTRKLNVADGLEGMAKAIAMGDAKNFPTPFNVVEVLRFAARMIRAKETRQ